MLKQILLALLAATGLSAGSLRWDYDVVAILEKPALHFNVYETGVMAAPVQWTLIGTTRAIFWDLGPLLAPQRFYTVSAQIGNGKEYFPLVPGSPQ